MGKIYCKNCIYNTSLLGKLMGQGDWGFCIPAAKLKEVDVSTLDLYTISVLFAKGKLSFWMSEQNKNNDCSYYKRKWWRFWGR